jgi:biopolymer transport protein ExbD
VLKQYFKPGQALAKINMTPLIDVSLVLVIILLLLTPLAFETNFMIKRSAQAATAPAALESSPPISLVIASEDSVRVEERVVSRSELAAILRALIGDEGRRQVIVACAGEVSHGAFVNVIDQARLSGAAEIAIAEP